MVWQLLYFGATFVLSLGLGLYLTPIIRAGAIRFGVLDEPDGKLKSHREPVPYLGGIAVYLAFLTTLALVFDFAPRLLALLLGGTMVAMVGLFDDLRVLPARLKLIGQLMGVWVLIKTGIGIELTAIPTWLALPLTIGWVIGITNAINIVDVSDAVAAGVSSISALALFCIAVLNGDLLIATTTLALLGAIMGFLRYNLAPARIFLGDTGSMFIGFMLGALAMIGAYTERGPLGGLAPLFILMVPILDTLLVVAARARRGRSPFQGSPDHFAVRLRAHGWSSAAVAHYAWALAAAGAVIGISLTLLPRAAHPWLVALGGVVFVVNFVWMWTMSPAPVIEGAGSERAIDRG